MIDVPEIGEVVDGRYKVLARLGTGGMADVFLAEDQQLGRKVALKLLHRRFAEDPGFVERFRREAQAAAGLQHPNVVSVYDRGEYEGTYYIAMEYLPGPSLKEMIRLGVPMDPVRAIDIVLQILKAARFAHRRGIIHRDLKPHNVMVDDAGHAKVTDFGIARAGASDMTETGSIMGTSHYLSPEQAQGRPVTPASDLYSVGVVLYELLTGRVPFDGDSPVTIALKHVSEPPPPIRPSNPAVPLELEQVVMWTLNKDPAHRPQDADVLISALEQVRERILAGAPLQQTSSFVPLPAPLPEREVVPVALEPPPLPGERNLWPWLLALLLVALLAGGAAAYLLTRTKRVVVPPVTGEMLNLARTQLENVGFSVSVVQVPGKAPSGTVIGEVPGGGTKAPDGATINLTVSSGPGATTVPTVVRLSVKQAEAVLGHAQLKVARIVPQSSDSIPTGQAIGTDPAAGQTPPAGTAVTLLVSSGKPQVNLPDVTNENVADAKATLQKLGFTVTTTNQQTASQPPGTVISQSPAGNTQQPSGATVNLVIARAPSTVQVPGVTGDTQQGAQASLSAAGLGATVTTQTVTKPNQDGIVIAQSPAQGQTVNKGSTVKIVVGHYQQTRTTSTTSTTATTGPSGNSGTSTP